MSETVNLRLPFMEASQSQKHVTHNDALLIIDAAVHLSVLDAARTSPPASPVEGDRHIVAIGATGGWLDHDHAVATYSDGGWLFLDPRIGWRAWSVEDEGLLVFDGSLWRDVRNLPTALDNLGHLGVGTTADATNPVSAKVNNTLWAARTIAEGGDGNLRYKLSKEDATKTLSFLFQDNYSGRAEIGLCGDDNFHFKVSPDGASWYEGIRIDRTTGKVFFPISGGPREVLSAARTYYVRTDGSDSNDGLTNTAGGAFLTIAKAMTTVAALDLGGYAVTVQVGAGTYTAAVVLPLLVGGTGTLIGDTATPSNVILSVTSAHAITAANGNRAWTVRGFKLTTTTAGYCFLINSGSAITYNNLDFGAAAGGHITVSNGSSAICSGNYTISGSAPWHVFADSNSTVTCYSVTITISGTPVFSTAFAFASGGASLRLESNTFSGSATGKRYQTQSGAIINVAGAGTNYLPGDSAGTGTNFGTSPYGLYA
jgi:hypothetical protein